MKALTNLHRSVLTWLGATRVLMWLTDVLIYVQLVMCYLLELNELDKNLGEIEFHFTNETNLT